MDAPTYTADDLIKYNISLLEAQTLRSMREFIMGDASAVARLRVIDGQIVALRAQLNKGA